MDNKNIVFPFSQLLKTISHTPDTDKKENKIFHIYEEIQMGLSAKLYMRKGFLI